MKYNLSMFDSIKDALNKQQTQSSGSRDIMAFEKGNTYVIRLLPNMKDPEKTWFKYQTFAWNSFATGQYTSAISPISWGERDPIAEERIKIYRTGTDADKEKIKSVRRSERWLMKVYVIADPTNPDNNGKVKLIRFGKQLFNIINNAISGEDSDEFGARVFDLGPGGVNFKIKVTEQGGYTNYTESRFTSPTDLKLTEQQIEEVYNQGGNLETVYTCRAYDELKKLFDEHYYCKGSESVATHSVAAHSNVAHATTSNDSQGSPFDVSSESDVDEDEKMRKLISSL
jgi:hypothetical protein